MAVNWETLDTLRSIHEKRRKNFPDLGSAYVGGEGSGEPEAFIFGEAPGAAEAAGGRPFIGPAGRVLRDLMASAGLVADPMADLEGGAEPNCWLTNVVKFRPPGNRTPHPLEVKAFRPLLQREWRAVGSPRLIIPVGGTALYALVGRRISILKASGQPIGRTARDGKHLVIWPMIHPSFALRNESARPVLERDWERLAKWLETRPKSLGI